MKVSNYILITIIVVLGAIIMTQNKVIVSLKTEYETGLGGGDIIKAQTIDSLQHVIDSLHDENYPCQIELTRHEVALELFKEKNKKAADEFELILTTQTE